MPKAPRRRAWGRAARVAAAWGALSPALLCAALLSPTALAQKGRSPDYPYRIVPVDAVRGHLLEGAFREPMGVCYDAEADELLVADTKNGLIGIFRGDGLPTFTFGGPSILSDPTVIEVGKEGTIYVLAGDRLRIQVFNYRGEAQAPLECARTTKAGEPPRTVRIGAMARRLDGAWWLFDSDAHELLLCDEALGVRTAIGAVPNKEKGLHLESVSDIALAPDGTVALIDLSATPVQILDAAGKFLRGFGKRDIGLENFTMAAALAFDELGFLYVVDLLRHDVKVFDREGRFMSVFGGWFSPETAGRGPGEMLYPADIAISPHGRIYVAERFGQRVQIFDRLPAEPATGPGGSRR